MINSITDFFNTGSTAAIARRLLGKRFAYRGTSAWITETEAYIGIHDRAAHAYGQRKTHQNRALYMAPGTIYVYSIYGHDLINFITQPVGDPQGVLIRAVQPATGIPLMRKRRHMNNFNLTNGPGKLCQAMGIDLTMNTKKLNRSAMRIDLASTSNRRPDRIETSGRIGVPNRGKWTRAPLRYFVAGNPYVSKMPKGQMNLQTDGWK